MKRSRIQMTAHGYERMEQRVGLTGLSAKHRVELAADGGKLVEWHDEILIAPGHHYFLWDGLVYVYAASETNTWFFKTVLFFDGRMGSA